MRPLPYEVNVDKTSKENIILLVEETNKNATTFGTYEEAKERITINLQIATIDRKKTKMMKRVEENLGGEEEEA